MVTSTALDSSDCLLVAGQRLYKPVMLLTPWRLTTFREAEAEHGPAEGIREWYLDRCLWDCLDRCEAPFASHGLYTRILDDDDPVQRAQGMAAGAAWLPMCDYVVAYVDYGESAGMTQEIAAAEALGLAVLRREIGR